MLVLVGSLGSPFPLGCTDHVQVQMMLLPEASLKNFFVAIFCVRRDTDHCDEDNWFAWIDCSDAWHPPPRISLNMFASSDVGQNHCFERCSHGLGGCCDSRTSALSKPTATVSATHNRCAGTTFINPQVRCVVSMLDNVEHTFVLTVSVCSLRLAMQCFEIVCTCARIGTFCFASQATRLGGLTTVAPYAPCTYKYTLTYKYTRIMYGAYLPKFTRTHFDTHTHTHTHTHTRSAHTCAHACAHTHILALSIT